MSNKELFYSDTFDISKQRNLTERLFKVKLQGFFKKTSTEIHLHRHHNSDMESTNVSYAMKHFREEEQKFAKDRTVNK